VPSTEARFLAYDNVKFTDIKARQAISMAINYEELIASLYAGDGIYDGPVGQGLTAFALDQETLKSYRVFDPQQARALWEQAGSPLDNIRIEANQDPRGSGLAEFLGRQLEENLGVSTEVLIHDTVTWVARAREPVKQWELFIVPYNFTNTPETYNMTMMDPGAFAGVSWSFAVDQPNSPEVQELAKQVRALVAAQSSELDPEERKRKLDEMQTFILENYASGINIPVPGHSYVVYNSRLQNFPEDAYLTGLGLRTQDMWIKEG
jgi:ABC-type transport system substrate-binding protein